MYEMGAPYKDHELLSFQSVSKGSLGECGLRGGFVHMSNIHPGTMDEIYKIASINLAPNTIGQVMTSLFVNPPRAGDESYESYWRERREIIASMRRRAHIITDAFNSLEGVACQFIEGAMYSFPSVRGRAPASLPPLCKSTRA